MKFTKMHGLGNDYIYINCFTETVAQPNNLAISMSDRHFGVGGDGIVLIMPSEIADARMRMFNADGSEAEMCGNAIRCVGKYLYDRGIVPKQELTIETKAGIKKLQLTLDGSTAILVRVDMGEPVLQSDVIPVTGEPRRIVGEPVAAAGHEYRYTAVSMGNPHAVIFVPEITDDQVLKDGPLLEVHPFFPKKINVEFVTVLSKELLQMRVWERGSGETLACGTGASATVVAAVLNQLTGRRVTVKLLGGDLIIEWDETTNHVFMTGPAVEVFDGEYKVG
jgi:diaminopimelate epimerase